MWLLNIFFEKNVNFLYSIMVWLIYNSLPFYAHAHTCGPNYTDKEYKTKVDSEAVCHRLLIVILIVALRLWLLYIAYHKSEQSSKKKK